MTFSEEREFVKKYEENKNLALRLLREIGACKITPLTCIPLKDFEIFKQLICLQAWLKEHRDEYLKLQSFPGIDMSRYPVHLILLEQWIDEMVKSVVIFKNPNTINTHNKEEPMDNLNWKERVRDIWDSVSHQASSPINWEEVNNAIEELKKDFEDDKFVDLPSNRKPFFALFCDHLIPLTNLMIRGNGLNKNETELEIIEELYNEANIAYVMLGSKK